MTTQQTWQCFFCKRAYSGVGAGNAVVVTLRRYESHFDVGRTRTTTYSYATVEAPRCEACEAFHKKIARMSLLYGVIVGIIASGILIYEIEITSLLLITPILVITCIFSWKVIQALLDHFKRKERFPVQWATAYPTVRTWQDKGFHVRTVDTGVFSRNLVGGKDKHTLLHLK